MTASLIITRWVCDDHGLGFLDEPGAREHDRECGRVRHKSLAELQSQMDRADAELRDHESELARSKVAITVATSSHRRQREATEAAKQRADDARAAWAAAALPVAKQAVKS